MCVRRLLFVDAEHLAEELPDIVEQQSAEPQLETSALGTEQLLAVVQKGERHPHRLKQIRRTGEIVQFAPRRFRISVTAARMNDRDAARIKIAARPVEELHRRTGNDHHDLDAAVPVFPHRIFQNVMGHVEKDVVDLAGGRINFHNGTPYLTSHRFFW